MRQISEQGGRTVLFVSHNMAAVSTLCTRAMLLGRWTRDRGRDGSFHRRDSISLLRVAVEARRRRCTTLRVGGRVCFRISPLWNCWRTTEPSRRSLRLVRRYAFGSVSIFQTASGRQRSVSVPTTHPRGAHIFAVATYLSSTPISRVEEKSHVLVTFKLPALYPGQYMFDVSLSTEDGPFLDQVDDAVSFEILQDGYLGSSHPYFPEMGVVLVPSEWSARSVTA